MSAKPDETTIHITIEAAIQQLAEQLVEMKTKANRQDELLLGMQREISLLASAISGHQAIIEASQPETKAEPPKPPTIVH
ncbi:hypothetical protein [Granulicella sp. S190]|uniref:hypothetical protein n=1 Tax=Granulicella sp. S190 TaxID=1747226 RepID=UPI00131EADC3|nr:hypothetical protein [Granulicella sp. S190]